MRPPRGITLSYRVSDCSPYAGSFTSAVKYNEQRNKTQLTADDGGESSPSLANMITANLYSDLRVTSGG